MSNTHCCIDAGSDFCPCILAETLDCISCSQLQGTNKCDCSWNGICIYNELHMLKGNVNGGRKEYKGYVVENQEIDTNVYMLKIRTDKKLVKLLNRSGSYVLLRDANNESHFNVPMSILEIEGLDTFIIAYKEKGIKTKLLKNTKAINIKGPYWNGIQGLKYLKIINNSNCLVIVKGISQSSIVFPIREMIRSNNIVFVFLDNSNIKTDYALDFLRDDLIIIRGNVYEDSDKISEIILNNNIKLVFSAASDLVHKHINELLKGQESIYYMTSNNNVICCAEGICGSCIKRDELGKKIKMCKSQINSKIFFS